MAVENHAGARHGGEWPRLDIPDRSLMSDEQRAIFDRLVSFFGAPAGPRVPLLFAPDLYEPWANLGQRLSTGSLPKRLRELAILATARFWGASFAWSAHTGPAREAGVSEQTIEDIKYGRRPQSAEPDELAVYDYCVELLERHAVSDPNYGQVRRLLGVTQQVELTVVIGHYTNVSLSLLAHAAPTPGGATAELPRLDDRTERAG